MGVKMSSVDPIVLRLPKLINKTFQKKGIGAAEALSSRLVKKHGERVVLDALKEMRRIAQLEEAEADADYARAEREHAETMAIFEGLPTDTTFGAACRIKAAQGDRAAQRWVNLWNSPCVQNRERFTASCNRATPGMAHHWRRLIYPKQECAGRGRAIEWFYKNRNARSLHSEP
jgi:hypothetical protein